MMLLKLLVICIALVTAQEIQQNNFFIRYLQQQHLELLALEQ